MGDATLKTYFKWAVLEVMVVLSIGLLFVFISPVIVLAAPLFSNEIETNYKFGPYTHARVVQNINLRSDQTDYYPQSFTLGIDTSRLIDLQVFSGGVPLEDETNGGGVRIRLPDPTSLTTVYQFELYYNIEGVVRKKGRLHEITLPLITRGDTVGINSQKVKTQVPASWGAVQTASIDPTLITQNDEVVEFTFDASQVTDQSEIQIVFGPDQLYEIQLSYHLSNPTKLPQDVPITFPPNFGTFQQVYIKDITPLPNQISFDADGNFIGTYKLRAGQKVDVEYQAQIKIDLQVDNTDVMPTPLDSSARYTIPDKYWESNDPAIIEVAANLTTAADVYQFVTRTLTYDVTRIQSDQIERFGAVKALEHQDHAVCMEFTDLSIALLRALNIPSREVNGFAYLAEGESLVRPTVTDVLHAWVQYYDNQRGWVNIDPTWGNSTGRDYFNHFDNDHIIFAIQGVTSEGPLPAGVYRGDDFNAQDVRVSLSEVNQPQYQNMDQWITSYHNQMSPWWTKLWQWMIGLLKRGG